MTMNVRMTRSCAERYSCLRCITNCFASKRKQNQTNIITLDGVFFFTKEFLDLKEFHSTKAQAIVDEESDEDDKDKNGTKIISPTVPPERGARIETALPGSQNNYRSAGRNTEERIIDDPANLLQPAANDFFSIQND